jgi:hypothetical protein
MWDFATWANDWGLGLTLTVVTVIMHVLGLGVIGRIFERLMAMFEQRLRRSLFRLVLIGAPTVALVFLLHATEAIVWAVSYVKIGAVPTIREAVLYSLGAMSTYGHAQVYLAAEWQALGAIQALNGMIIFGLTVGFLAAIVRRVQNASAM